MQLVGVSNSPYFRRTVIALQLLGVPFDVKPLSPFIHVEELRGVNPVMKGESLWLNDNAELQEDYVIVGLALAGCEKCLQVVYETRLRPEETRHQPWLQRIESPCRAAFAALDVAVAKRSVPFSETNQANITAAVVWNFSRQVIRTEVISGNYPALDSLSAQMEALPVFQQYAHTAGA